MRTSPPAFPADGLIKMGGEEAGGVIQASGALEQYLLDDILPQLASPPYGAIIVAPLSGAKPVYAYFEPVHHITIIGKVFQSFGQTPAQAWDTAQREFANLTLLREQYNMRDDLYHVVAPLGKNRELRSLLVTRHAPGRTLDHYIAKAIYRARQDSLFRRLGELARFFIKLHRNSETVRPASASQPRVYLEKMLGALAPALIPEAWADYLRELAGGWWNHPDMISDCSVLTHGDATPTNFLFYRREVTGIDLEKMRRADRCWDLGFIAAELKHHFAWRAGNPGAAEPFIGHFLWEYAANYRGAAFFRAITRRLPLYMALGLLRIARNNWLETGYRKQLVSEAEACLKFKP